MRTLFKSGLLHYRDTVFDDGKISKKLVIRSLTMVA